MLHKMPEYILDYFVMDEDLFFEHGEKAPMILLQDLISEKEIQKRATELFRLFCGPQYGLVFSCKWMPRITKENVLVEDGNLYQEIVSKCFAIIIAIEDLISERDEQFENMPMVFPRSVFGKENFPKDQIKRIFGSIKRDVFVVSPDPPSFSSAQLKSRWKESAQNENSEMEYTNVLSRLFSRLKPSMYDDEDEQ